MKTTTVTCDECGVDLSVTTNVTGDYRIALSNERIPYAGGAGTCMFSRPLLPSEAHFCSGVCLKLWVGKNVDDRYALRGSETRSARHKAAKNAA